MTNGKAKGSEFERAIAKTLSLWASEGARKDVFWRTPGSGSRHTVINVSAHAGDICATHELGRPFCERVLIECKHYRKLDWVRFLLNKQGNLWEFWLKLYTAAFEQHRIPILIAKENGRPTQIITDVNSGLFESYDPWFPGLGCTIRPLSDLTSQVYSIVTTRIRNQQVKNGRRALTVNTS